MRNGALCVVSAILLHCAAASAEDVPIDEFNIHPEDVQCAKVVLSKKDPPWLDIELNRNKAMELAKFTGRNIDKKVRIKVGDQVVFEPVVRTQIFGGPLGFPCKSPEEGLRIAKSLTESEKTLTEIHNQPSERVRDIPIRLRDGRDFIAEEVLSIHPRLVFQTKGWLYDLPDSMLAYRKEAKPVKVQRIEISGDTIMTPEGKLKDLQELIQFLCRKASRSNPAIIVMTDNMTWPEARGLEFSRAIWALKDGLSVGTEVAAPEKPPQGDKGSETPKK